MNKAILFLSIISASGLTIVSIYNRIVDPKSWGSDIPASIQTARDYYQHVDPRRFYAIAGPVNLSCSDWQVFSFPSKGSTPKVHVAGGQIASCFIIGSPHARLIPPVRRYSFWRE